MMMIFLILIFPISMFVFVIKVILFSKSLSSMNVSSKGNLSIKKGNPGVKGNSLL